jgi:hypothetical protein
LRLDQERIEGLDYGVEACSCVTVAHHADTSDVTNFAGVVDQARGYFGSTNIYAD